MSPRDVSSYEMSDFHDISDADLDAIRAGRVSDDDPRLGALARFLRDLDEAHPEPSTQALEGSHVAAMMETARLLADNGEPVARPASKAHGPGDQASGLPKPRRSIMWNTLFASTYAKVGAGALALLVVFAGTAAAGVLPDPVQSAVAGAAASVGIALPDPSAVPEEAVPEPDDAEVGDLDEDDLSDVDEDGDATDDLEDADDEGEDASESRRSSGDDDDEEGDDRGDIDDDADEGSDDSDENDADDSDEAAQDDSDADDDSGEADDDDDGDDREAEAEGEIEDEDD